ncbi:MAG: VCBS repeat-containing protein [Verrucomicrobia bacterium]|nr:VCBS repeat-containing protein [Verrucomicrobiota bacterium]
MRRTTRLAFQCCLFAALILPNGPGSCGEIAPWRQAEGYRWRPLTVEGGAEPGFTRIPPDRAGVLFSNTLPDALVATNRLLEIGSGVALGDVDGDGRIDIYLCRIDGPNALYRNLGDWRFEDITQIAGVACPGQRSTGAALADLDGDGDLDLLVNSLGGGTRVFLNDGRGRFTERTDAGLSRTSGATSMALADFDGDGDLDLYVAHYRADTMHDHPPGLNVTTHKLPDGRTVAEPADRLFTITTPNGGTEVFERGEVDAFYLNLGGGRFSLTSWEGGTFLNEDGQPLQAAFQDWGLAVMFRDLDGDGLPDLYVCNDFVGFPDRVWINEGGKRFRGLARMAMRNTSLASMTMDSADINRDGRDDLFVADMLSPHRADRARQRPDTLANTVRWPKENPRFRPEIPRNTLHLARGDGSFTEIAQLAGLAATDWTWSAAFLDVDLDGWEDLLLATGALHDVQDSDAMGEISRGGATTTPAERLRNLSRVPHRLTPSMAFRNRRDLTFEDQSRAWGFDLVGSANGMAFADMDNDGDLDVVINCLNGPPRLLKNRCAKPRLAVRLRGAGPNSQGIGARSTVTGGPVAQSQEIIAGGRYLSSDDPMRVFAAEGSAPLRVEVRWRSGRTTRIDRVPPNSVIEVDEASAPAAPDPGSKPSPPPLFQDLSKQLDHRHVDSLFPDFARHPLLFRKLSDDGPGLAWADVDDDGDDDLIVGGGASGRGVVLENLGNFQFKPWLSSPFPATNAVDQTGIVVGSFAGSRHVALVGESQWESGATVLPMMRPYPLASSKPAPPIPPPPSAGDSSTGPLALADIDGDGQLEVFVGARASTLRPGQSVNSRILEYRGGEWRTRQIFESLGMVSGAVFADLNNDGRPDLALACQWESVRVFINEDGVLKERTQEMGLAPHRGLWNGIAVGDFDGDGHLDLAVSNWGRNWRNDTPQDPGAPVRLYSGDFAGNGLVQTIVASVDPRDGAWKPWRDLEALASIIPAVRERVATHRAYGSASMEQLLGDDVAKAQIRDANAFDSAIFLWRAGRFEIRALPIEAQFAPAFGVNVADFDGDGREDLFLAQNFFGTDPDSSRCDGGAGLILLGDGKGGFRALSARESGVVILGEQRGSAVGDFDGDGRPDLAVAQNRGPTQLLHNTGGSPGVRIRLKGDVGNPDGIGTRVRVRYSSGPGAVREAQAGSGYWSQNSTTLVFPALTGPLGVEVAWPHGMPQTWTWPTGATNVEVTRTAIRALP